MRRHLHVPRHQLVVCGLALGYADDGHCLGGLRTDREPVESYTTFHG